MSSLWPAAPPIGGWGGFALTGAQVARIAAGTTESLKVGNLIDGCQHVLHSLRSKQRGDGRCSISDNPGRTQHSYFPRMIQKREQMCFKVRTIVQTPGS